MPCFFNVRYIVDFEMLSGIPLASSLYEMLGLERTREMSMRTSRSDSFLGLPERGFDTPSTRELSFMMVFCTVDTGMSSAAEICRRDAPAMRRPRIRPRVNGVSSARFFFSPGSVSYTHLTLPTSDLV